MINSDPELKNLSDFLLLNAGLSRDNCLQSGKLAVALFFFHIQKHQLFKTPADLGKVYLEEIKQEDTFDNPTYAQGLLGAGVVFEHLAGEGLLHDDMTDARKFIESILLYIISTNKTTTIDIASGFTGAGLYLVQRLRNAIDQKNSSADYYKKQLKHYLQRLKPIIASNYLNENRHPHDMCIWDGATGLLLFLHAINDYGLHNSNYENIEKEITSRLLHQLIKNDFDWFNVEAYFGLLHGSIVCRDQNLRDKLLNSFMRFVDDAPAHLPVLYYKNAAFIALLLTIIGEKYNCLPACALGERICNQLKDTLANHAIGKLFKYNPLSNTFEMGIYGGICGTALPLLSLQTANYDWLKILGIEIKS